MSLLQRAAGSNFEFLEIVKSVLIAIGQEDTANENDKLVGQLKCIEVLSEVFESSLEVIGHLTSF